MTAAGRVPERGDLVQLRSALSADGDPAVRHPALVISPQSYNQKVGLVLVCPITSSVKGYPFEVALPEGLGVQGAVLCDQLRSLDWTLRAAAFLGAVPGDVMREVTARILALVDAE